MRLYGRRIWRLRSHTRTFRTVFYNGLNNNGSGATCKANLRIEFRQNTLKSFSSLVTNGYSKFIASIKNPLEIPAAVSVDFDMTSAKLASVAPASLTIDQLLNAVPEDPALVLSRLRERPELASAQDSHGYSLLHAATSFGHPDLLRALVQEFQAPVNIVDEDGDTALFTAESVAIAEILVKDLNADLSHRNSENITAKEYIEQEGDFPAVAAWLRRAEKAKPSKSSASLKGSSNTETDDSRKSRGSVLNSRDCSNTTNPTEIIDSEHPPPPLPPGVSVNVETLSESTPDAPDPQFRKRIEELAARDDFDSEESQKELKRLITDAVNGLALDEGVASTKRKS